MTYTLDTVQRLYFETKDQADVLSKRHAEELAPLSARLDALKQWMHQYLVLTKQESATTEHGNCHLKTATSVSVGEWSDVLGFVLRDVVDQMAGTLENGGSAEQAVEAALAASRLGFLNHAVNKTAVMEWIDQQGSVPPGVKVATVLQIGVRRT